VILTLTPNPALDRTVLVDALIRGAVHRARGVQVEAAGKGVNITRALSAHAVSSVAVMPIGGRSGTWYRDTLTADGVAIAPVEVTGTLRTNVAIVEPDGTTTKINEPGPVLTALEEQALLRAVTARLADQTTWVVGCGSLPPDADAQLYRWLIERARSHGVRCAVDSSHAPMRAAVEARPDLIKPNLEELEELVDARLNTFGDVVRASRELLASGIETVLVSLGGRGALLVQAGGTAHAYAQVDRPLSTVGAGDALLAGYLSAVDTSPEKALATGVAWGSAAVGLPGTQMPTPRHTSAIPVTTTDRPDLTIRTRR